MLKILLRNVKHKFVKESCCISIHEGKRLLEVDISDFENLKSIKDLGIGISASKTISKFNQIEQP